MAKIILIPAQLFFTNFALIVHAFSASLTFLTILAEEWRGAWYLAANPPLSSPHNPIIDNSFEIEKDTDNKMKMTMTMLAPPPRHRNRDRHRHRFSPSPPSPPAAALPCRASARRRRHRRSVSGFRARPLHFCFTSISVCTHSRSLRSSRPLLPFSVRR